MKAGFIPGAKVRAKADGYHAGIFRRGEPETARIVRYDLEGFYIVQTSTSSSFVVHEDDIELVPKDDIELVPKEEPCSACGGSGEGEDKIDGTMTGDLCGPREPGVSLLHELKTWPDAFEAIEKGTKHHEIRKNDRRFIQGDLLQLREWDPSTEKYTGRERTVRVSYVSYGGAWGLPEDLCVMSIEQRLSRGHD